MTNSSKSLNLAEDLKHTIRSYFKKYGIDFYDPEANRSTFSSRLKDWLKKNKRNQEDDKEDVEHILVRQYVNLSRKFIPVVSWKVKYSSKVRAVKPHHPERKIINILADKFRSGENINPYLSKGLLMAYDEDQLHATWKMYHLHLSNKKSGHHYFMDRSDKLLMVFLHGDTVHFVDIRQHKETDEVGGINVVWSRQELLHILHNEFPEAISSYKLNGILPPKKEDELTDTHLETLKRKGVNPMFTSGEAVFAPMGGGIATNGSSAEVTMHSDMIRRMIYEWEKFLLENQASLKDDFKRQGIEVEDFSFRITHGDGIGFFVYDEITGARLSGLNEKKYFERGK